MANEHTVLSSPGFRSGLKVALLVVTVLVLLIPLGMIRSLVGERESRQEETTDELVALHGGRQVVMGPLVMVPMRVRVVDEHGIGREELREIAVAPTDTRVSVTLDPNVLQRGIYRVPVYDASIEMAGTFVRPDTLDAAIDPGTVDAIVATEWNAARLVVAIAGVRGLRVEPEIWIDDSPIAPQSANASLPLRTGIAAPIAASGPGVAAALAGGPTRREHTFRVAMKLAGAGAFHLVPTAMRSRLELASSRQSPSFTGDLLPSSRDVGPDGFHATWDATALGMGMPDTWMVGSSPTWLSRTVGVELFTPIDTYQRTLRSVKYGALFILLPFVALYLLEIFAGLRIHPVQYLLVAAAKVVFYLLLLSLSEHIAFALAYAVGAVATCALITLYVGAFTAKGSHAALIGTMVAAEYGFLYAALASEDYALLIGSIGLFVVVAAVMIVTRRLNWYRTQET